MAKVVPVPKQKPVKQKTDAEKLVAQALRPCRGSNLVVTNVSQCQRRPVWEATLSDLQSMVDRKCKLLALSAPRLTGGEIILLDLMAAGAWVRLRLMATFIAQGL